MFYHCAKWQFALQEPIAPVAGGVIAASAMPRMQLLRRQKKLARDYPWLAHRFLDPQLYLAGIPTTSKSVPNLATYPWFGVQIPNFDSAEHRNVRNWMEENEEKLKGGWEGKDAHSEEATKRAVKSAVDVQLSFGAEAIIIPSRLTTLPSEQYERETLFLDYGIEYCRSIGSRLPLYATVSLSDEFLRGAAPTEHPLLRTITAQIAAREEVAGAYLVLNQAGPDSGHCYACEEGCLALLLIVDELTRGAGKRVAVNYAGTFGAVLMGAGAAVWASGHYRSQRRFRLADQEEERGSAFPRYFSQALLGDVGVERNVDALFRSRYRDLVLTRTRASEVLLRALNGGKKTADVPEWSYIQGNVARSAAHYYELCTTLDAILSTHDSAGRIALVERGLRESARLAATLKADRDLGLTAGSHTDVSHQEVWLNAYRKWRAHAGV